MASRSATDQTSVKFAVLQVVGFCRALALCHWEHKLGCLRPSRNNFSPSLELKAMRFRPPLVLLFYAFCVRGATDACCERAWWADPNNIIIFFINHLLHSNPISSSLTLCASIAGRVACCHHLCYLATPPSSTTAHRHRPRPHSNTCRTLPHPNPKLSS
jgi:hypothetical protein